MESFILEDKDMIKYKHIPIIYKKQIKVKADDGFYREQRLYYNLTTGKMAENIPSVTRTKSYSVIWNYLHVGCSHIKRWGAVYDKKFDMLAIILFVLSVKDVKEGDKRNWEEVYRIYINKDKEIFEPEYEEKRFGKIKVRVRTGNVFKKINSNKLFINTEEVDCIVEGQETELTSETCYTYCEISKMFPTTFISNSNHLYKLRPFTFSKFISTKEIKPNKNSKLQKKLDKLLEFPLSEVSSPISFPTAYLEFQRFASLERVKGGDVCVLRNFFYWPRKKEIVEFSRLYITNSEIIAAKRNNFGEFVVYNKLFDDGANWNFNSSFGKISEKIAKNTKLSYLVDIINDVAKPYQRGVAIAYLLKYPIFEILYKEGYREIVKICLHRCVVDSNIILELEDIFGKISKGKNLYKTFGINKFQFNKIFGDLQKNFKTDKLFSISTLKDLKFILNGEADLRVETFRDSNKFISIADMDNDTFLKLYNFVYAINCKSSRRISMYFISNIITKYYGLNTLISMMDKLIRLIACKEPKYIRSYLDFLTMLCKLELIDSYDIKFNSLIHILDKEKEVIKIYDNLQEAENKEKFDKRKVVWEKFVYSDSNYTIVYPDTAKDLAKEGNELNHCVKSYIDKVTAGKTNILFIRKQGAVDKPFFTVEISDNGNIEQIHGFNNRNLNTEPDLIYFIKDWIAARDLKLHGYNKVR